MSYRIAIVSDDGVYVNAHFGSSTSFHIFEVNDDGSYFKKEERSIPVLPSVQVSEEMIILSDSASSHENISCGNYSNCGNGNSSGCGNGSRLSCENNNSGNSCGKSHSDTQIEQKVTLIADCRCLLCKKIGPSAERQLGRKAITTFQIDYKIDAALLKIIEYYSKMDNHISLRKG